MKKKIKDQSEDYVPSNTKISHMVFKRLHREYFSNDNKTTDEIHQQILLDLVTTYADNEEHKQRLLGYLNKKYFWPSTPVFANIPKYKKTYYGSNIACFLLELNKYNYSKMLYSISEITRIGAGIGVLLDLPSMSEDLTHEKTAGFRAYVKSIALTMKINAGKARATGSLAVYMNIDHLDIVEFIEMRKNKHGADPDMFIPSYIHHGIVISDEFMEAVRSNTPWGLKNSKGEVVKTIPPRDLLLKIINVRFETGEPYIMFKDNVNREIPEIYKKLGFKVTTSNLCTEIVEKTGIDHKGIERIAICCLGSLNLSKYQEWSSIQDQLFEDILRMYDNVLTYFICFATKVEVGQPFPEKISVGWLKQYKKQEESIVKNALKHNHPLSSAIYAAWRARDLGIGVCGFNHLLQKEGLMAESKEAQDFTKKLFNNIQNTFKKFNIQLAEEMGACEDGKDAQVMNRFTHVSAIAPTSSLASHCNTSRAIEQSTRFSLRKTSEGSNIVINNYLEEKLVAAGITDANEQVHEIKFNTLGIFTNQDYKLTEDGYATDQSKYLELLSNVKVDQAISLNSWFSAKSDRSEIITHIMKAWKLGFKTLYYAFGKAASNQSNWNTDIKEEKASDCELCE